MRWRRGIRRQFFIVNIMEIFLYNDLLLSYIYDFYFYYTILKEMLQEQMQGQGSIADQQNSQKTQEVSNDNQQEKETCSQKVKGKIDELNIAKVQTEEEKKQAKSKVNPFLVNPPNKEPQIVVNLFGLPSISQPFAVKKKSQKIRVLYQIKPEEKFVENTNPSKDSNWNPFSSKNLENIESKLLVALKETDQKTKSAELLRGLQQISKYIINEEEQQLKYPKQKLCSNNGFYISPSYEQLRSYSQNKLSRIEGLKIWNNYGQIQFLQDVSIKDVRLQSIIMAQNKIQILSDDLSKKKKHFLYRNYLNYANLPFNHKKTVKKQIFLEMERKQMEIVFHNQHNGDLIVY